MVDGKPTVMIGTPAYGGAMFMEYVDSLIKNIRFLDTKGIIPRWHFMNKEALITRGRNEIVRYFMDETHDDYLMFIDADICFPEDGIYQLLQHEKDICCGIYPKKNIYWKKIKEAAVRGEPDIENFGASYVLNPANGSNEVSFGNKDGLIEVLHGGTGFMLIHRRVFKALRSKVPIYRTSLITDPASGQFTAPLTREFFGTSITPHGLLLSEDYHFCDLWTKEGGQIFADPTIKLKHVGQYTFSGDLSRAGLNNT